VKAALTTLRLVSACSDHFICPILRDLRRTAHASQDLGQRFRDHAAIFGVGHSRLGKVPGVSSLDLLVEAMRNAIEDEVIFDDVSNELRCRSSRRKQSKRSRTCKLAIGTRGAFALVYWPA
jgi:hypothetical protein